MIRKTAHSQQTYPINNRRFFKCQLIDDTSVGFSIGWCLESKGRLAKFLTLLLKAETTGKGTHPTPKNNKDNKNF
tara:strand:- start:39 stop:263 length:225 start_codon:yes stop_codon:yes gene_type:complete